MLSRRGDVRAMGGWYVVGHAGSQPSEGGGGGGGGEEDEGAQWAVGVALTVVGSIGINLGTNMLKLAHNRAGAEVVAGGPAARSVRGDPVWVSGFALFGAGNVLNFAAMAFAAQSLLAPVGAVQFLTNVVFAWAVLGATPTRRTVCGTLVVVAGVVVMIVYSGERAGRVYDADELVALYGRLPYVMYILCALSAVIGMEFVEKRARARALGRGPRGRGWRLCRRCWPWGAKRPAQPLRAPVHAAARERVPVDEDEDGASVRTPLRGQGDAVGGKGKGDSSAVHPDSTWTPMSSPSPSPSASSRSSSACASPDFTSTPLGGRARDADGDSGGDGDEDDEDDDEVRAAAVLGSESEGPGSDPAAAVGPPSGGAEPPWMAYSFALRSALVGTQSVVFAKSTSLLLRASVTGAPQFDEPFTYCVLAALGATALFWCQRLNAALRRYPSLVIIPALQINWIVWSSVAGGLYFDEFSAWDAHEYALFGAGIAVTLVGLALLEPEAHTLSDAPPASLVAQRESARLRALVDASPRRQPPPPPPPPHPPLLADAV